MSESDRAQLLSYWTETAQFEHAAVASFARFSMQLMAIGAPAGLVEATVQADEIRHARIALGIASALADHELGLGLPIDGALDDAGDVRSMLVDTIREACVNETVSAAQCRRRAAKDPFIKRAASTSRKTNNGTLRSRGRLFAGSLRLTLSFGTSQPIPSPRR